MRIAFDLDRVEAALAPGAGASPCDPAAREARVHTSLVVRREDGAVRAAQAYAVMCRQGAEEYLIRAARTGRMSVGSEKEIPGFGGGAAVDVEVKNLSMKSQKTLGMGVYDVVELLVHLLEPFGVSISFC